MFKPIKYGNKNYPNGIVPEIKEVAAHFDNYKIRIDPDLDYSLHTEYSHSSRKLEHPLLDKYTILKNSHKKGIPQLWYSKEWALEFSKYLGDLVRGNRPPRIIEIHPPFNDYCHNFDKFSEVYSLFEREILNIYPDVKILIENRAGTRYSGGRFLLSNNQDFTDFNKQLNSKKLNLKVVLDLPQLFTAHGINFQKEQINPDMISKILTPIMSIKDNIKGIHIWGKKIKNGRLIPHNGDLNNYFNNNLALKNYFLREIYNIFNDNIARYFVPEVNSSESDLQSIINDFIDAGFRFI